MARHMVWYTTLTIEVVIVTGRAQVGLFVSRVSQGSHVCVLTQSMKTFCLCSLLAVANSYKDTPTLCWCALFGDKSLTMSLTEKVVLDRSKAKSLAAVRNLNVWGCQLTDISIVSSLPNLEVLNLR